MKSQLLKIIQNENADLYIIGETAYNHEGDFEYLKSMARALSETGAKAVKYHMLLNLDSYMNNDHPVYTIIQNWIFTKDQWIELVRYSNELGLEVIMLVDDIESINCIIDSRLDVAGIELHSTGLNDYHVLRSLAKYEGVILLGVGGTDIGEVHYAIETLNSFQKNDVILMYGFQKYPTDYKKINLKKMAKLGNLFNLQMGYADHTRFDDANNFLVTGLGLAMGARIIEKHFTLDEGVERVDFQASIGIQKFNELVSNLELIDKTLGNGRIEMTEDEKLYGVLGPMKKAMVASHDLQAGHIIDVSDIIFKRTKGLAEIKQSDIHLLVGKTVKEAIKKDEIICFQSLEVK